MDEADIRDLFGTEVYSKTLVEGMAEGYLADVDYHIVFDEAVKQAMDNGFKPKSIKEIKQLLENESRNDAIAEQIRIKTHEIGLDGAKTIVFCDSIEQADEMAALLDGNAYHSNVDKDKRRVILSDFKADKSSLITTRDMFNEGVDIPDARLIVFLRSTASQTIFEQQLGRGLRKIAGKDTVSVLDFVANVDRLTMVKNLVDGIRVARGNDDDIIDVIRGGLSVSGAHADFDFDQLAVDLLDKLGGLKRVDFNIDTIEDAAILWHEQFPGIRPTYDMISKAASKRRYITLYTLSKFGGVQALNDALGNPTIDAASVDSMEDIVTLWQQNFGTLKPTARLINQLSKEHRFVSSKVIDKHGGTKQFYGSLGYRYSTGEQPTIDELADKWRELFPDTPPTTGSIAEASKQQLFTSLSKVNKAGGIIALRDALGYGNSAERNEVASIADAAALWQKQYPGVYPTHELISEASKRSEFISSSALNKLGNIDAFRHELGYKVNVRPTSAGIETAEDAAALWQKQYPDVRPDSAAIDKAYENGTFISASALRKIGGIASLQELLGYTTRGHNPFETLDSATNFWIENFPDIRPTAATLSEASKQKKFISGNKLRNLGGIAAMQQIYDERS